MTIHQIKNYRLLQNLVRILFYSNYHFSTTREIREKSRFSVNDGKFYIFTVVKND
jgi:hypothetical protein